MLKDRRTWSDLIRKVDRFSVVGPEAETDKRKATVFVPVDLRFSIDQQFEELMPRLRDVQAHLLRACGRHRVFQPDEDVIRRNAYCYVLSTKFEMSAPKIAEIVFPSEKRGAAKVRKLPYLVGIRRHVSNRKRLRLEVDVMLKC